MNKILLLMVSILTLAACQKKTNTAVYDSKPMNVDVFRVKVAPVTSSADQHQIQSTGLLTSDLESKPSFKTGGIIERTFYQEGDRVSKGALLATLNMSEIKAQVAQAQRAVEKSSRDLARVKNLYADTVATLEQLQNVQTAYDLSTETLKIAEFNQTYSQIRAPFAGTIIKQLLREGEVTGPGMPVYAIMGTGQQHWIIKAAVSDKEWAIIKKGDKAQVRFEAFPGILMSGVVDHVADFSNAGTATLDIEIKLLQPHTKLAAGLIANIIIQPNNKSQGQMTIPIEALVSSNAGQAIVFVPQDGKAIKKSVSIDKILGSRVTLSAGLQGIQEVITAGAVYLQDGDKIEIIP